MNGIVIINKSKGYTSHDIVAKVKKITGEKVGHTGTAEASPCIYNCFNLGIIDGLNAGGIIGYVENHSESINVYSLGKITGNTVGGIVGSALWNNTSQNKFENCYFLKSDTVQKSAGSKITVNATMIQKLTNTEIDEMNNYIKDNTSITSYWKKWKLGENGYPIFE